MNLTNGINRALAARTVRVAAVLAIGVTVSARAQQPASDAATLTEVIVTAQRRAENLQRTPVAVTAFSAAEIESRGILNTKDLGYNTPGLETVATTGTVSGGDYTIRGIGQDSIPITYDTGVGLYIDDVYIARTYFSSRELFDLDHIDVLRGPQGTLYGRNTSGGAINLYTKQPDQTPSIDASGYYGNYDSYAVQVSGNLPLSPIAALRITASRDAEDRGYLYNTTLSKRVSTQASDYFHAVLKLDPSDALDVRLSADYEELASDGLYFSDPNDQPFVNSSGHYQGATGYGTSVLNYSQSPLNLYDDAREYGISANITYTVSDAVRLHLISAYRGSTVGLGLDLNNEGVALEFGAGTHEATEELQLQGTALDGHLNYIGGVYYFHEIGAQYWVVGLPLLPLTFQDTHATLTTDAEAAYLQATYSIIDPVRLTAGLRYSHEKKTLGIASPLGATPYDTATLNADGIATSISTSKATPKVALEGDLAKNVLGYISYTKGFKGGGFNSTAGNPLDAQPFSPETVNAYELGEKSQWFDNRWRVNASLFVNKLSQGQFSYFAPGTGNLDLGNVASATIKGIELESNARLTTAWSLFGYVDYTDNKIDGSTPLALEAGIMPGNQLKEIPKWKYQVGSDYSDRLGFIPGRYTLRATWTWTDKSYNSPTDDPIQVVPAHERLDLRARYDSDDDRWFAQLEGDNVTDFRYATARLDVLPTVPAQPNIPALYRIRVGVKFQ